jgi:hypothetical protein
MRYYPIEIDIEFFLWFREFNFGGEVISRGGGQLLKFIFGLGMCESTTNALKHSLLPPQRHQPCFRSRLIEYPPWHCLFSSMNNPYFVRKNDAVRIRDRVASLKSRPGEL